MIENQLFLSIVIPVYNGEDTISRCLESIWSQGLDENEYEVICVNDCSSDNTVELISGIQEQHANLRLLSNKENLRAGGSRNQGVKEAKGQYVLFIDADDYFHEGHCDLFAIFRERIAWIFWCVILLDMLLIKSTIL